MIRNTKEVFFLLESKKQDQEKGKVF